MCKRLGRADAKLTGQRQDLETFLNLLLDLGDRIVCGRGPVHRLPLFVHHELGEVPLDRVDEEPALLLLQEGPQRMGGAAVDVDLGEHVERHVVFCSKLLKN